VDRQELFLLLLVDAALILTVICLHKRLLAICFDEEQASLQGLPVQALYLTLLVLTAIAVVLLIHVVGVILVIAMLTIPPAIANLFTGRLSHMMMLAVLFNALFCAGGMAAAFYLDWPAGATITLIAGSGYLFGLLASRGR
jgi:zinc transport system permease protein